jgi:hypothetical protein
MKNLRLPLGIWWGVFTALVVFIPTFWWFRLRPERQWPVADKSMIVGFYNDGKNLATFSFSENGDKTLCIWDCQTGKLRDEVAMDSPSTLKTKLSRDARWLAYVERKDSKWQLRVHDFVKPDDDMVIGLPEKMSQVPSEGLVTLPTFSEDNSHFCYQEDDSQGRHFCLWDLKAKRLIHRQESGCYQDTSMVVRFDQKEKCYTVWGAATGRSLGTLPALPTATEFEFSANADGTAFMILGGTADPNPRLIKYRFDLKSQSLNTIWEQPFSSGKQHSTVYEFYPRSPQAYLARSFNGSKIDAYWIDAMTGTHHSLPLHMPFALADTSANSLRFNLGGSANLGTSMMALDDKGTRIISPDGRYIVYFAEEQLEGIKLWLHDLAGWLRVPLSRNRNLIVVDLLEQKVVDVYTVKSHLSMSDNTLCVSPSSQQIALITELHGQQYVQLWTIPLPSRSWLGIVVVVALAGLMSTLGRRAWYFSRLRAKS